MNSIESLKVDFNTQLNELPKISNDKISNELIYVGSGDSYVAGLIVEYLTDHKCKCYSPSDLFNSRLAKDNTYCFISVTGKTKANIKVAKRASKAGVKTVAVTLNNDSPLAKVCDQVIPVNISRTQTPNAGFGTFVANVVTSLQIAGITIPQEFDRWHKNALKISRDLLSSFSLSNRSLYILGNSLFYPVAMYASLQTAEFFGKTAIAHKLEEFCHSPIFGHDKSDSIWILGQRDAQIKKILEALGPNLSYFELYNKDIFAQLFISIFLVQKLLLLLAEKHGYSQLQYVIMKDVLKASSEIIYDQTN